MTSEEKKKKIRQIITKYKQERDEYLDGWKRAKADFENYKKDEFRRCSLLIEGEKRRMIARFIKVLDNFNRAESEIKDHKEDSVVTGVLNIKKQIEALLKEEGVEEIVALHQEFDPNFHEAVEVLEKEGIESGVVIEEFEKGYTLNGETLRPAKVKVTP